ncbi:putative rab3 GTPase-activating protein non-catalytic subunit [Paratrimastix pyriformis]|uniref:Rab3 GTPase-activating protein non-catalytic subunit n=1 Tax=Paratrimastix pyriformis TaxID=342808 RepID=A0ABQ8UQ92_9EUKA|nr:putative rab3 GTPase-activating protein non-catalytic subunit [Paratrimastix pyriformis]
MFCSLSSDGKVLLRVSSLQKHPQVVTITDTEASAVSQVQSPNLLPDGEQITSCLFLCCEAPRPSLSSSPASSPAQAASPSRRHPPRDFLVLGYSSGTLRIFHGTPPHKMVFQECYHEAPITRVHVGIPCATPHLLLFYSDAVVVRLEGNLLKSNITSEGLSASPSPTPQAASSPGGAGSSATSVVPFGKWSLEGVDSTPVDCICAGFAPFRPPTPTSAQYHLLAVGHGLVLASFEASDTPVLSTLKQATAVATKITSAVFSFARSFFAGPAAPTPVPAGPPEPPPESSRPPVDVHPTRLLRDAPRECTWLSVSPCGTMLVAGGGMGRLMLHDVETGTLLHMWKGYRDAQCGWLTTTHTYTLALDQAPGTGVPAAAPVQVSEERDVLVLVIYVPYRGLLEAWRVPHCVRVDARSVGACRLLMPQYTLASAAATTSHQARSQPFLWSNAPIDLGSPSRAATSLPSRAASPTASPAPGSPPPASGAAPSATPATSTSPAPTHVRSASQAAGVSIPEDDVACPVGWIGAVGLTGRQSGGPEDITWALTVTGVRKSSTVEPDLLSFE